MMQSPIRFAADKVAGLRSKFGEGTGVGPETCTALERMERGQVETQFQRQPRPSASAAVKSMSEELSHRWTGMEGPANSRSAFNPSSSHLLPSKYILE